MPIGIDAVTTPAVGRYAPGRRRIERSAPEAKPESLSAADRQTLFVVGAGDLRRFVSDQPPSKARAGIGRTLISLGRSCVASTGSWQWPVPAGGTRRAGQVVRDHGY